VYAETGGWEPPNWVFNGLTPEQYVQEATRWTERGATIIGGCCGVGVAHIQLLASQLGGRTAA
jgi:S-methylmethionine-dependent homocysteine/selenocysteine methylase